ncbi:MAG: tetratricopeptide repeat protein [Elusimicrobiota bacterium]
MEFSGNLEKIKTFESESDAKGLADRLKQQGIDSKMKSPGPAGPYDIWVPQNTLFTALGIVAEFEINIKKREGLRRAEAAKKKSSAVQKKLVKIVLVSIILVSFISAGMYMNKFLTGISDITKEIKPVPLQVDVNKLESGYKGLIENVRKSHKNRAKKKISINSMIFKWNLNRAERACARQRFDIAMQKLEKCLKEDRENNAIISMLLTTYLKLGHLEKAKILLKESYVLPSADKEWKKWVTMQIADIYMGEKNYFGAEYELSIFLEKYPDDIAVLKKLALANRRMLELNKAVSYIKRVLLLDEKDTAARLFLAELLIELASYEEAEWVLSSVYDEAEDRALLMMAEIYSKTGRLDEARSFLGEIGRETADSEKYRYIKGINNYGLGDYNSAKDILRELMTSEGLSVSAELYSLLILLHENRLSEVEELFPQIAGKCDDSEELSVLHYGLACMYLKKNMQENAWEELVKAYSHDNYILEKFKKDPLIYGITRSIQYKQRIIKELKKR